MATSGHSIYISICLPHQAFFILALGEGRDAIRSSGSFSSMLSMGSLFLPLLG